jgi:hypothetical protein
MISAMRVSDAPDQRLLEALLDSWDRNNAILLNLLRGAYATAECASPRRADALQRRSYSVSPSCFCIASSPVRYSRSGSAQMLSGILPDPPVVRGGRSQQNGNSFF